MAETSRRNVLRAGAAALAGFAGGSNLGGRKKVEPMKEALAEANVRGCRRRAHNGFTLVRALHGQEPPRVSARLFVTPTVE